jgi:hypothetical protein
VDPAVRFVAFAVSFCTPLAEPVVVAASADVPGMLSTNWSEVEIRAPARFFFTRRLGGDAQLARSTAGSTLDNPVATVTGLLQVGLYVKTVEVVPANMVPSESKATPLNVLLFMY